VKQTSEQASEKIEIERVMKIDYENRMELNSLQTNWFRVLKSNGQILIWKSQVCIKIDT
jgi:hypothetical protein